jgi:hypothetical protein
MAMNVVEQLSSTIRRALPDATVTIDEPSNVLGNWWIDIRRGSRTATIEWRPKQGFGVGLGEGTYGEGPDVISSTIDGAAQHITDYFRDDADVNSPSVLVASGDIMWRAAVEEHLHEHQVWTDSVETLTEATMHLLEQTYLVVLVDLATTSLNTAYAELREQLSRLDSLLITVATVDHVRSLDDSFELVMHKRIGAEYVASVVESLVAAAETRHLPNTNSKSA